MYIYLSNKRQFFMSSIKTEKVRSALIRIDVAFNHDCSSVEIHNLHRAFGTNVRDLVKTIEHVVTYARINSRLGVKRVTCLTPKIAESILRKAGFDTIENSTVYNL